MDFEEEMYNGLIPVNKMSVIEHLPDKKSIRQFTIIVRGEKDEGKTTLIRNLKGRDEFIDEKLFEQEDFKHHKDKHFRFNEDFYKIEFIEINPLKLYEPLINKFSDKCLTLMILNNNSENDELIKNLEEKELQKKSNAFLYLYNLRNNNDNDIKKEKKNYIYKNIELMKSFDKNAQEILILCIQKMMGFYEKNMESLSGKLTKSLPDRNYDVSKSIQFSKNNSCSIF